MAKVVHCRDVGFDCDGIVRAVHVLEPASLSLLGLAGCNRTPSSPEADTGSAAVPADENAVRSDDDPRGAGRRRQLARSILHLDDCVTVRPATAGRGPGGSGPPAAW